MYFMFVPCAVPAEGGQRSFEELSNRNSTKVCAAVSAAIKPWWVREVGLGTRSRTQRAGRTDPDRL